MPVPVIIGSNVVTNNALSFTVTTTQDAFDGEFVVVGLSLHDYDFVNGPPTYSLTDDSGAGNTYAPTLYSAIGGDLAAYAVAQLQGDMPSGTTLTFSISGYVGTPPSSRHHFVVVRVPGVTALDGSGNNSAFFTSSSPFNAFQVDYVVSPVPQLLVGLVAWDPNAAAWAGPGGAWTVLDSGNQRVFYREFTSPDSGTASASGAFTYNAASFFNGIVGVIFGFTYPAPGARLSVAYNRLNLRLRAVQSAGALDVERFDDAWPPAVAATVSVEAADCTGTPDLKWRRNGIGELVYAKDGDVLGRHSRDQGRTWSVADTIATGYNDACQAIDERRGLKLVGLYDESAEEWYLTIGEEQGGTWGSWSSPALLTDDALAGAALTIRSDGVAEFDYTDTSDVRQTLRCRSFHAGSIGTWS